MNRNKIISSALIANSDNPQEYISHGLDLINCLLREYKNGDITIEELTLMAKKTSYAHALKDMSFNFTLTQDEIRQIVNNVISLHARYMPMSKDLEKRIVAGLPQVIAYNIFLSSEAALSVINNQIGFP
jgi:hypothetical protein